jgi:hypothetical protein
MSADTPGTLRDSDAVGHAPALTPFEERVLAIRQFVVWRWRALSRALPARDLVGILLAGGGSLFVFISLLVDWQMIKVSGVTIHAGIADIPTWGTVYVLGAMGLIAIFVCVVALPMALGRSARVLGIAWALGVASIIVAMLVRLTDTPAIPEDALLRALLGAPSGSAGISVEWGSGIVYGAIAVAMLIGAFIAACPPLRDISVKSEDGGR